MSGVSWAELLKDDVSLEEVQELVRTGEVNVKETDCDGNNILHKVCSLNTEKSDTVEYLISVGAAVNQVNVEGCTALIVCASKGYLDTLRVLLNHGACVDPHGAVKAQGHDSAVLAAGKNGHEKCANELIKHGADVWYRNDKKENLLLIACKIGLASLVKYCLEHGSEDQIYVGSVATYYRSEQSPVWYACENGHLDCLQILLNDSRYIKKDTYLKEEGYVRQVRTSLILTAAVNNHEDCVLELMYRGADITSKNSRDENLLMVAVSNGMVKVVKECLARLNNEEVSQCVKDGKTVVMVACENNQYICLQELLKSGKCSTESIQQVSKSGFTALMLCARNGFLEGLKLLIQHKAEINVPVTVSSGCYEDERNREGNSALLLAAKSKHEECVKILIDHGADIWCKNKTGQNLLMVACEQGLLETVKYCLSHGCFHQITDCDDEGKTALFHAYKNIQVKCIKVLMALDERTSNILLLRATRHGENFLHLACKEKIERPDIVEILASNSFLIDSEDPSGFTPLMICAQKGHLETLKVLVKNGASLGLVQCSTERNPSFKIGRDVRVRNTALLMAAIAKHEECVTELMQNGADIWYENNHGQSLLELASANGLTTVVKQCLRDAKLTGKRGEKFVSEKTTKAMQVAIAHNQNDCAVEIMNHVTNIWSSFANSLKTLSKKGMTKAVKKCLESRTDDTHTEDVNKALQAALVHNHEACAHAIMAHGADIWYTNDDGQNALMLAAEKGLVNVLKNCGSKATPDHVNKKDQNGRSALFLAASKGHQESVKLLLGLGANPNVFEGSEGACILLDMIDRGNESCVSEVISQGANFTQTNSQGKTLLMHAVEKGLVHIVRACLEKGSKSYVNMVDNNGNNAVTYACEKGRADCLKELLKNEKCSPMKVSAVESCPKYYSEGQELLKLYCNSSSDSVGSEDNVNKQKKELLRVAARSRFCSDEQEVLDIALGIDIWHTNDDGQNLLMIAAHGGLVQIVRHCVSKATFQHIHTVDHKGNTAVALACQNIGCRKNLDCLLEMLKSKEAFKKQKHSLVSRYNNIDAQIYGNNKSLMQIVCSDTSAEDKADIVDLLVQKGASVNVFDVDGLTPLMVCARRNYVKSLSVLLRSGASVDAISRLGTWGSRKSKNDACALRGNTALHLAAMKGYESCVQQLISHGADIWSCNNRGENLLMLASANGLYNTVKLCLNKASSDQLNKLDKNGSNAVIHACKNSGINSLALLLQNPHCLKQINTRSMKLDMTPLMLAMNYRCLEIFKRLLAKGADPNYCNQIGVTCLLMVVGKNPRDHCKEPPPCREYFRGNPDFLDFVLPLLQNGADVNHTCFQTRETALTVAAKNSVHPTIVEALVKHGATVNHADSSGNTALMSACEHNQDDVIQLLLDNGASVSEACKQTGKSVLTVAVANRVNISIIETLLKHEANVNHVDPHGNTALHSSCKNGQENVSKLLLQNGANVNQICKTTGDSALTFATENRASVKMIGELLKFGADVNHFNADGNTALCSACQNSQEDIAKLLLEHGAIADYIYKPTGQTALTHAVVNKFPFELVAELLKQGAKVNHVDKRGMTALKSACRNNQKQIVKILLKNGASLAENPISVMYGIRTLANNPIRKLIDLGGVNIDKEQKEKPEEGVVSKLYDLCRIPARQHVMNSFPNSNLFYTIPRLVLPRKMKDFLLYDYDIDKNDDSDIPGLPGSGTQDDDKSASASERAVTLRALQSLLAAHSTSDRSQRYGYDFDDYDDYYVVPSMSYSYYDSDEYYYDSD